ncbi:phosphotransferase [Brenneria izadpanahii]|uniref:Hydroxylysine kinase n=1 Tax=Brenneria izadpanahii TaxID=2722756 RepID=A0ABX7UY15_9GAMM|nr:phosphotransferase [Brenneria izadpanahii]QTF08464.1 phosphotransferase [Brenneria izadpanahii]
MSQPKTAVTDHLMTQSVPQVSCQQAADIALRLYGLRGDVELLQGERDLNFCLSVTPERRYMLKVINAAEPTEVSHFQTNMLLHIAQYAPDLLVPRVVITQNQLAEPVVKIGGVSLRVRLVSYLEGIPQYKAPQSVELMQALGENLARLDLALQNFSHPAAHRPLLWDISRAEQVRPYLDFVDDRQQYQQVTRILDRYDQFVAPRLKLLRQQTIHNDLNPHNALVNLNNPTQVTGIIDFGDALHAPLIAELATALAYQVSDSENPFEFVTPFLAAYHQQLPLTEEEIALLPDLIAVRMTLGIIIPQWRSALYPENRDYLLRNLPQCWRGLSRMANYSYEQCHAWLRQSCQ